MRKLIVTRYTGAANLYRAFHIRQGLPIQVANDVPPAGATGNTTASTRILSFSANGTQASWAGGNVATAFKFSNTSENATIVSESVRGVSASAVPILSAITPQFHAVAYSGGFSVVDASTDSVVASASGLGGIGAMEFSPDGSRLAIAYSGLTKARVYNTSDWSFTEAVSNAVGGTPAALAWSADSSEFAVGGGTTSPYWSRYDRDCVLLQAMATIAQGYNTTSLAYTPDGAGLLIGSSAVQVPSRVIRYTLATATVTPLTSSYTLASPSSLVLDDDGFGYFYHTAVLTDANGRAFRICRFNYNTMSDVESAGDEQSILMGNEGTVHLLLLKRGTARLPGVVRDKDNNPAERDVYAYDRASKRLVAKTTSDALGNFELKLPNDNPVDVVIEALDGENLNDLYFAAAEPLLD